MVKKPFLLALLFVFMFLASGCLTINTDGCCPNKNLVKCPKKVVKTENEPNIIEKADNWVKDKLW